MNVHLLRFYGNKFFAPENEGGAEPEPEGEEPEGEEPEGDEPEGDEPEGEEPEGEEPEGDEPEGDEPGEPAAPQRRENRFQRQANELRTEREARIRAEERARIAEESKAAKPAADTGEAARVRAEKIALMEPAEKETFLLKERLDNMERSAAVSQIQLQDATDKSSFDAKATVDPTRAKYAERIETTLADMRRRGSNAPRETVFSYLLGEDAKKKLEAARKNPGGSAKAKAAAAARVKSSQGAPTSARGDGGGKKVGKGESLADLESRLRGHII